MHISNFLAVLISLIVGGFFYLFFCWKRLKEDYHSRTIFTSALIFIFVSSVVGTIFNLVFISSWFWGAFLGFSGSFLIVQRKYNFRIFETFEATSLGLFIPFLFIQVYVTLFSRNSVAVAHFILLLLIFFVFIFLEMRYKRFTWYKSGRVGLSGLAALGLYFLIRSIIVVFANPSMISFTGSPFVGRIDTLISGIVSFLLFGSIYWLSKQ